MLRGIVAKNRCGTLGKDGKLAWKSVDDFKHFKSKTRGAILIVGRKTFEVDLGGKELPGRRCFVVGKGYYTLFGALEAAILESLERNKINACNAKPVDVSGSVRLIQYNSELLNEDIWVIGGKSIYDQLGPLMEELHISTIMDDWTIGDVFYEEPRGFRGTCFHYEFYCDLANKPV